MLGDGNDRAIARLAVQRFGVKRRPTAVIAVMAIKSSEAIWQAVTITVALAKLGLSASTRDVLHRLVLPVCPHLSLTNLQTSTEPMKSMGCHSANLHNE